MNRDEPKSASQPPSEMGVWEWNFSQDSMVWDEPMHALFGMSPGTFGGASEDFLNRVHPGDRAHLGNVLASIVESDKQFVEEFRIVWSDGTVHSVLMQGILLRDSAGKPSGMSGTCQVTLNENPSGLTAGMERTMFAALMDNLPDCIYFKDMDSRMIVGSQAAAKWFGYKSPQELVGITDSDLFTEEHARQAREDEREILETGVPLVNMEEKETWSDGHITYVSTSKMPLRNEQGRIVGTFGLSRDITERKQAEQQLARFAEELRHKNEALEEELAMARELQLAMLPQGFPAFYYQGKEAARFYHFFQPSAAVSGDFFDVYEIADDRVGVFVCDVMGHGVRASLVAATARALVEQMAAEGTAPEVLMASLNSSLRRILRNNSTPLFVSASYLVADFSARELIYANAGHPRPIHVRCGDAASLGGKTGPVLGLFDEAAYERCVCCFTPGDTVLFFTDGLFEVESAQDEIYDYSRLLDAVQSRNQSPMKDLCRGVVEEVQQFSANREFSDDVCLVGMELA